MIVSILLKVQYTVKQKQTLVFYNPFPAYIKTQQFRNSCSWKYNLFTELEDLILCDLPDCRKFFKLLLVARSEGQCVNLRKLINRESNGLDN